MYIRLGRRVPWFMKLVLWPLVARLIFSCATDPEPEHPVELT